MWKNISIPSLFIFGLIIHISNCSKGVHETRKFTTRVNPGCESVFGQNCSQLSNISLIHIQSDGKNDSYHFVWSFADAPTLLMARTSLNTSLSVDWIAMFEQKSKNSSISFDPKPYYTFGWSLVKVWMFDDVQDVAQLDKVNQSMVTGYHSNKFQWERQDNQSYANATNIRYTFIAKAYDHEGPVGIKSLGPNGFFKFTVRMKSSAGYSDVLPYMLYSESSTQVDIAFNDVQLNLTEAEYPAHPRVGFNYILVQDEYLQNSTERMRIDKAKTLDDEHTPGVFETYSLRTPVVNKTDQSFIQWKPICYTGEIRNVEDSVDVWSYPLRNASSAIDDDFIQDSMLWSYYGSKVDELLLESMNISFGTQQDGFYNKTKHISWTYSTGFGQPPEDYVSTLVILVVAIGLGIPTVIIIIAIVYVTLKRFRTPRDDLLLGR